ncbi:unnamed protein product [marine sediment metagenome]|uniref:Uncharacterized protein n=1 Tax=marine sediment metagenome TaxID=412755 RepID=X0WJP9_9ZZZZ
MEYIFDNKVLDTRNPFSGETIMCDAPPKSSGWDPAAQAEAILAQATRRVRILIERLIEESEEDKTSP